MGICYEDQPDEAVFASLMEKFTTSLEGKEIKGVPKSIIEPFSRTCTVNRYEMPFQFISA